MGKLSFSQLSSHFHIWWSWKVYWIACLCVKPELMAVPGLSVLHTQWQWGLLSLTFPALKRLFRYITGLYCTCSVHAIVVIVNNACMIAKRSQTQTRAFTWHRSWAGSFQLTSSWCNHASQSIHFHCVVWNTLLYIYTVQVAIYIYIIMTMSSWFPPHPLPPPPHTHP